MADRAQTWAIRMYHESTLHPQNSFLTLTYDEKHLPSTLVKRDVQLFIKRMRRSVCALRFFAVGEYGGETRRPHYHLVIFGNDFLQGAFQINETLYGNPYVQKAWSKGLVSIARAEYASMAYVAGYAVKKIGDKDTFNLMSRKPAIGKGWIEKYRQDIINNEKVVIEGKELPVPKCYLTWHDDMTPLKENRIKYINSLTPDQKWHKLTHLRSKEINKQSSINRKRETV